MRVYARARACVCLSVYLLCDDKLEVEAASKEGGSCYCGNDLDRVTSWSRGDLNVIQYTAGLVHMVGDSVISIICVTIDIGVCFVFVPYPQVIWYTLIRYSRFVFRDLVNNPEDATPEHSSNTTKVPNSCLRPVIALNLPSESLG